MVSRTDGTVCSDGGGDDDVSDSTDYQLEYALLYEVAYMAPAASRQLRPRATCLSARCSTA